MKQRLSSGLSFSGKLILFFIILLSISSLIIGITGYLVAKNELNRKGSQILKNSVVQALDFIESEHSKILSGIASKIDTQERIKEKLIGPLDTVTGTRSINNNINLGENGYFIIYDSFGNEIMHPTLEGQNVYNVKSFDSDEHYLVREQIETGMSGGGFVYYSWMLPHSGRVSKKISYCMYYAPWDWIVVATAYEIDFNRAANIILLVIIMTMSFLIILVSGIIIKYVKKISKPIIAIAEGMGKVAINEYSPVETTNYNDELGILINGYNNMVETLKDAEKNLTEKENYISFLAYHDELTALPNRHGMEEYVNERITGGCRSAYMVQADIVGLKIINSALGFKQGDRMLEAFGSYLSHLDNPDLFPARTSGNEFSMWAENIGYREIIKLIYELRDSAKEYINEKGFGQIVDMHLAMAAFPENGSNFGQLYEKTSITMKSAKESNNQRLNEYNDSLLRKIENELSMRRYLRKAIDENEFHAFYQTQVDFRTGKITGVEALARWDSSELGAVSPAVFIPAINDQNLVEEFSTYMMERVLSDYPELKKKYNNEITVSINISPTFFMDKNFIKNIEIMLKRYSIPPKKIILEITEDVFISDFNKITEIINHLHNLGLRISIDDFGTGYSSLNYLTRINFDEMKIDKSFINKIIEDERSMEMFKVLCQIAEIYGYEVVAEGVETDLQLEKIRDTSLRIIQGYIFSKPEPLDKP